MAAVVGRSTESLDVMKNVAALALGIVLSGGALAVDESPEQAVLEALLIHVVGEARSQSPAKAFCVSGYEERLIPTVRARVKETIPSIADETACPKQDPGSRNTDYVWVWLGAAVRINDEEFIARARVYRNPLHAEERTYTLRRSSGQWTVAKSEVNWVS